MTSMWRVEVSMSATSLFSGLATKTCWLAAAGATVKTFPGPSGVGVGVGVGGGLPEGVGVGKAPAPPPPEVVPHPAARSAAETRQTFPGARMPASQPRGPRAPPFRCDAAHVQREYQWLDRAPTQAWERRGPRRRASPDSDVRFSAPARRPRW